MLGGHLGNVFIVGRVVVDLRADDHGFVDAV